MRDYAGFIETRQTLLHLKASNRNNWISFAIAHHLNKDYELAVQVRRCPGQTSSTYMQFSDLLSKSYNITSATMYMHLCWVAADSERIREHARGGPKGRGI